MNQRRLLYLLACVVGVSLPLRVLAAPEYSLLLATIPSDSATYTNIPGIQTLSRTWSSPFGNAHLTMDASGSVDFPVIRLSTAVTSNYPLYAAAYAMARTKDTVRVDNVVLDGQPGFVRVDIFYSWALYDALTNFRNYARLDLQYGTAQVHALESHEALPDLRLTEDPLVAESGAVAIDAVLGEFFSAYFPIVYGENFDVGLDFLIESTAAGGNASLNAMNSVYWGGLQAYDSLFNAVDFTLLSFSGTDYTRSYAPERSVPEPSGLLLVLMAMTLLSRRMNLFRSARAKHPGNQLGLRGRVRLQQHAGQLSPRSR